MAGRAPGATMPTLYMSDFQS
uniref:Uncharacterized protein n=1 Tax=Anguilla anguilla TaxID=7936 RepID=A0A0E9SWH3_ANGAN